MDINFVVIVTDDTIKIMIAWRMNTKNKYINDYTTTLNTVFAWNWKSTDILALPNDLNPHRSQAYLALNGEIALKRGSPFIEKVATSFLLGT